MKTTRRWKHYPPQREYVPAEVVLTCSKEFAPLDKVKFVNIEEDMQGKDVLTFKCPRCGEQHESHVYGR